MLGELRSQDVTLQRVGALFKLRTEAPDAETQACVVRACAAGLLYLGESKTYTTKFRQNIPEVASFEQKLFATCQSCAGAKTTEASCQKCKGGGQCSNPKCSGGTAQFQGFDGKVSFRQCPVCKGAGRCPDCQGRGLISKPCMACSGRGGVFAPTLALAEYRKDIEQAIRRIETLQRDVADRKAKESFESKLRETEVESKREAILVEAKATGEERARQVVLAEQAAAERSRKESEEAKYLEKDKEYLKSVVIIKGDRSTGTGFLASFLGKKVVLSNAHVLCGNRDLSLHTIDNVPIKYKAVKVCKKRDVVVYEIESGENLNYLPVHQKVDGMNNQEEIVIFGNSAGGGVATTLRGKMQGRGPDIIEVDAPFVPGNSGSPIIAYPYNAVVGMATYATKDAKVDWTTENTRFSNVRRYGVRIDTLNWSDFLTLDDIEYRAAMDIYDEIFAFAESEVAKIRRRGSQYVITDGVKADAKRLLGKYHETPEWTRQYSDQGLIGAFVCKEISK